MNEPLATAAPKTINEYVRQGSLQAIIQKAQGLRELDKVWQSLLPAHLQYRSKVANLEQDTLSIAVENAQWATELRYLKLKLLRQLQATPWGSVLQALKIYISPAAVAPRPPYQHRPTLSASSAQLIAETAAGITDTKLKTALLRLAKRGMVQ